MTKDYPYRIFSFSYREMCLPKFYKKQCVCKIFNIFQRYFIIYGKTLITIIAYKVSNYTMNPDQQENEIAVALCQLKSNLSTKVNFSTQILQY